MDTHKLTYFLIRLATYPFRWMPYSWIHVLGKGFGLIAYYTMSKYRKRTLSNLALAKDLALSPQQIIRIAKQSFQNLAINCLEYPKLDAEKDLSRVIQCENPQEAQAIYEKGQGILFFCGHQANWEVLFLDGTTRMQGTAIGKPTKNPYLYRWITSIREKNGGKIIHPKNAVREGIRALRKGIFMGIVGDQGMPDSGYSFPFLGRRAWTSPAPALLAYKTRSPLFFAATKRVSGGYRIHYSAPIWPDWEKPMEEEVPHLMDQLLRLLEKSVKEEPGQWLWQHNRWKQQTPQILYKRFRQDCICLILPKDPNDFEEIQPHLSTFKQIYSRNFVSLFVPTIHRDKSLIDCDEIIYYDDIKETLREDFRFKLVFNFTSYKPIHRHYLKQSAFEVISLESLRKSAPSSMPLSEVLQKVLCRPGSFNFPHI